MRGRAWWIGAAAVLVALLAAGWWGLTQARGFESLARAGKAEASAAAKSLSAGDAAGALTGFVKAGDEFGRARDLLGPGWLRGVPWLGAQLNAADDLATIGVEGSTAGAEAARLATAAAGVQGADRLSRLLALARPHVDAALTSLQVVAERDARLSPDGLVPPLADAVTEARRTLDPLHLLLSRSSALQGLERYLYSGQHRFVVLAQNNAQLRPTGGFPGTYGLVELGPEGVSLSHFADVYTLPNDTLNVPVPDGRQVNPRHLFFRAAGWWMDFPTSGDLMVRLWDSMKPRQPHIDGVIAIDLITIRDLLAVFGPIRVPESTVPLTADNVVEQLSYTVEIQKSGKDEKNKKDAVVSMAAAVMDRLVHVSDKELSPVLDALVGAARAKHVQVFTTDPAAQADLVTLGMAGAFDPPEGTTDLLAVSNTVIKRPAKGNLGVTKGLDYVVRLSPDGSADTTLTLDYRKSARNSLGPLADAFMNYVRIHRAAGTTAAGDGFESLRDATGLPTFARFSQLANGGTARLALHARVPDAVRTGVAPALPGRAPVPASGSSWHYRLLVAKQADLVDTAAKITVRLPEGWTLSRSSAQFRASGEAVRTSETAGTVEVTTSLTEDLVLDVTLVRP